MVKSGDKVWARNFEDSSQPHEAVVVSVNGANVWVMTDSGRQMLRWEHEVKPRPNSKSEDS